MQRYIRLCLWQVIFVSIVSLHLPVSSAEDGGIRIRGPKSTDAFPYDKYGPITATDTLWKIALTVRPDPSLTVYQVMQALYAKNPQAFKDNNLNHLVEGQYLKIPEISEIRQINPQAAQQKSDNDDAQWAKKVVKKEKPKAVAPVIVDAVKKQDLEQAKSEINVQLKEIDTVQQEKLQTIHQDVLDSMDGLQAILKENEQLRARLSSFNDQLTVMQDEVAKGQEIKMQMDDMIAIQQELLAKAEAREQELLFEKQQAELEANSFTSSLWFMVLMATVPALLLIAIVVMLLKRRQPEAAVEEAPKKTDTVAEVAETTAPEEALATEELSLDNEMSLEDELSLDDELLLDDELSIDIGEENKDDDLFDDSLDDLDDLEDLESLGADDDSEEQLLDDDVIHLDDDLEDLEEIAIDSGDGELLDGGELGQGDLDALLSGLDDDDDSEEAEELEGGVLDQDLLNDLLDAPEEESELNEDALLEQVVDEANEEVSDPDDIDALLDSIGGDDAASEDTSTEPEVDLNEEVSDPDDIDALLDSIGGDDTQAEEAAAEAEVDLNEEVSDPDDIDALLDSIGGDDAQGEEATAEPEVDLNEEVSDPDDIDALLDSIGGDDANAEEAAAEPEVDLNEEVSDPDDIDALLDSIGGDDKAEEAAAEPEVDLNEEVSDPDDIDALLDSIGGDDAKGEEAPAEPEVDLNEEVSDPDDIDALLDSIGSDDANSEQAPAEPEIDLTEEVSDPDDIDALLDSIGGDNEANVEQTSAESEVDLNEEISDPDDIDALLDSLDMGDVAAAAAAANTKTDADSQNDNVDETLDAPSNDEAVAENLAQAQSNSDDTERPNKAAIDNLSEEYVAPFLTMDFSDIQSKEANDSEVDAQLPADDKHVEDLSLENDSDIGEEISEESTDEVDDIDALLDSIQSDDAVIENEVKADIPDTNDDDDLSAILEELDGIENDLDDNVPQELIDSGADNNLDLELADITDDAEQDNDEDLDIDDELDIDALIAEVNDESVVDKAQDDFDIGDELEGVDTESSAITESVEPTNDEILTALSDDFDETTLSQLLQDEKDEAAHVELSPDFTDSNVLADLLAEDSEKKQEVVEANEMDDIQELDNLDFDELLANIEEENHPQAETPEVTDDFDIGDDLSLNIDNDSDKPVADFNTDISSADDILVEEVSGDESELDIGDDFVSVDSLLSESQDNDDLTEPYNKENIDVGLGDFPEFSADGDDDEDEKGMAAKLDLAKVYLEIGDKENAEVILQDVLVDGDEQQQYEARQLLDNF